MKASRLSGVGALCLFEGSGWILAQAWPSDVVYPFAGCIHFAVLGLVALCMCRLRVRPGWAASAGIAGLGVFVLPGMVLRFVAGAVPEATGVAIFCAVPVMILMGSMWSGEASSRVRGLLVPGIVALGVALLLFQVAPPASLRGWLLVALVAGCCSVVAAASIWMHRLMQGARVAAAVGIIGLFGAVAYGVGLGWPVLTARQIASEALRGAVFDLPVVWLTVWLAREVDPARLSARFLVVPLVNLSEGYVMIGQPPAIRETFEMAAMVAGAAMLLFQDESDADRPPGLRLR